MRIAYFDCFSGASGDMILAAMIDAGLSADALNDHLSGLAIQGYSLTAEKVKKQGFAATKVDVLLDAGQAQPHRHLSNILQIIDSSKLSPRVKQRATRIFTRLAEAEAAVHGTTMEKIHFHEVGAVDAIVDVVGASIGIELLGIDRAVCSPIPTGHGTVRCEHGIMPVPAPATAELLKGVPLAKCDEPAELTTPTGAAVLTSLAESFGPPPAMSLESIGVGAGNRDGQTRPNVMRILLGESTEAVEQDEVVVLEANLDDQDAQGIGYALDRLFEAGALDVYTTPILMKKSRPGTKLSVIANESDVAEIEQMLFAETTTFGVRRWTCRRSKLQREWQPVETSYGTIRIKIGRRGGEVVIASPEYEDCRTAARQHGVSLRTVTDAATQSWHRHKGG
jgi:uncharacterized protein (TIGR00299 family) protein